ncbi:hypothetical protein BDV26DRAFT_163075 [Aspergillus bertholletiae]|uniref:Uncharacterized protein n=1 Tax=Aspergillus bertholletiae TaxID=1226010 RepID=A0A5N7BCZ5_9EURO|nr:hypothetical protein BDV26DRAFT_163075 [Aspergillus bertholletiae]
MKDNAKASWKPINREARPPHWKRVASWLASGLEAASISLSSTVHWLYLINHATIGQCFRVVSRGQHGQTPNGTRRSGP